MRYSIHSILRSAALLLLVGVIFLGCNEITTAPTPDLSLAEVEGSEASASKRNLETSRMNDRFAVEKGAHGIAKVIVIQTGGIVIDQVKAVRLLPNHPYLLNITTCPPPCAAFPAGITVHTTPVTTNSLGHIDIGFILPGVFPSGVYRVDAFVTHDHPLLPGPPVLPFLGGRDPLLACQPAWRVTVL